MVKLCPDAIDVAFIRAILSPAGARGSLGESHSLFRDSYLNGLQPPVSATTKKEKKSRESLELILLDQDVHYVL